MSELTKKSRAWGFRFFATDAIVLFAAAAGAVALWWMENPIWWVLAIVVGHFFLFCNVVRLRRNFELVWSVLFILNTGLWMWLENLSLMAVLACQLPITAAFVIAEMRSSRYHGIFAQRLNPRLDEYLRNRQAMRPSPPSST
jgi:hypothetical protein